jgi:diguanylate cyclase (GGDEF)-like protein/PAS domain S-box-containing protein
MELNVSNWGLRDLLPVARYTAVVVSLFTFVVAIAYTVPELRRSVQELRQVETRDRSNLNTEFEMEKLMQETSTLYVEMIQQSQMQGVRALDSLRLTAIDAKIESMAHLLHSSTMYVTETDRFLAFYRKSRVLTGPAMEIANRRGAPGETWTIITAMGGPAAYSQATQELLSVKKAIDGTSARTILHASSTIEGAVVQLVVLLVVIFGCSFLFTWLEWRHRKMLHSVQEAHRELNESEDRFQTAYEEAAVGMSLLDLNGHLIGMNRAMSLITGFEPGELIGVSASELLVPEEREDSIAWTTALVAGAHGAYRAERRATRKDGQAIWLRNSFSLLQSQGKPGKVFVISEDVTERRTAFDLIEHQATHDRVTSLSNRFGFERFLREQTELHGASGEATGLLYIDLDEFKTINDTMGHAAGDMVLKVVADRISACRNLPGDLVARLGGDEFAMVTTCCTGREELARISSGILAALEMPIAVGDKRIRASATIGIALCPEDGTDPALLLQCADTAMYQAKAAGKHRFSFFTAQMREHALDRLEIQSSLRSALEQQEFSVFYQPLYELRGGSLVRFEALCRWRSPHLGDVSPARFIPVAEECGLIRELGEFVLREACRQARRWSDAGSPAGVSVNVSAIQFAQPDFIETVSAALKSAGLSPDRLDLELTESVILRNIGLGVARIEKLREIGVRVSIDDFGTGYSSLSYLQRMPVHSIKIDRSFVSELDSSEKSVSMIRSVIAMAHALGLVVVTEGVETRAQLGLLTDLGCDEVQGFLLGRPEPAESAMRNAERQTTPAQDGIRELELVMG